jgi:hypothetical protein
METVSTYEKSVDSTRLRSISSPKIVLFIATACRKANPILGVLCKEIHRCKRGSAFIPTRDSASVHYLGKDVGCCSTDHNNKLCLTRAAGYGKKPTFGISAPSALNVISLETSTIYIYLEKLYP